MVGRDTYLEHLASVPLFAACSRKDLQRIARASDEVQIPEGRTLMKRVRPYHLVIGFGVFWALFSIASGLGPLVFGWFDDSPIQREVFFNIPGPWKLAFYSLLPVAFIYGSVLFANRVKNWERGAPDARVTNASTAPKRLAD